MRIVCIGNRPSREEANYFFSDGSFTFTHSFSADLHAAQYNALPDIGLPVTKEQPTPM